MTTPALLELWVILPTYNGGKYLSEQLQSILHQTRLPDGVSLSDDASTDRTRDIIEAFAEQAPFPVRNIFQDGNVGLPGNAESAIDNVPDSADVIIFCDQDDVWLPDKLWRVEAAFTEPHTLLWFSDAELIDSVGQRLGRRLWEIVSLTGSSDLNHPRALGRMLAGVTIFGTSTAARATFVREILPTPRAANNTHQKGFQVDSWVGLMAHLRAGITLDPVPSTLYRRHPSQFTAGDSPSASVGARDHVVERLRRELDQVVSVIHGLSPGMLISLDGAIPSTLRFRRRYLTERLEVLLGTRSATHLLPLLLRGDYHKYAGGTRTLLTDYFRTVRRPRE